MKVELAQLAGRDNDTAYNLERALAAIAGCAADTHLAVDALSLPSRCSATIRTLLITATPSA